MVPPDEGVLVAKGALELCDGLVYTEVFTKQPQGSLIMRTTKIFMSGDNPANRHPKEQRYREEEVIMCDRRGRVIFYERDKEWEIFREGCTCRSES